MQELTLRLWDRDHGPAYSAYELEANKERFTGLAVGERKPV